VKRTILPLLVSIFCFSFPSVAQKLSANILSELNAAEKAMFNATSNGDSVAFRKLSGVDYVTINADGTTQTLEEALPFVPMFKGSTYQLSEQRQRQFGDVVLRTGRAKFFFGGKQVAEVLYTSGWVHREQRWQYIHWQGTPIRKMGQRPKAPAKEE
jgi:hypothetical protein